MKDPPDVTHVIPAHNEAAYLPQTLASVHRAAASFDRAVAIVMVDNASDDSTADVAREHGAEVAYEPKRCIDAARNRGAAVASGTILTFAHADSAVSENFFTITRDLMRSGKIVGGNFAILTERNSLGIWLTMRLVTILVWLLLRIGGGSYFCRRTTFDAIGGFDETLYYGEDVGFARAPRRYGRAHGLRYVQDRRAHVVTSSRKADVYGDWHAIRFLLRAPFMALRRGALDRFLLPYFYEFDKSRLPSTPDRAPPPSED